MIEATMKLDGRTAVEESGGEDGETAIDCCEVGSGFKDRRKPEEGVGEYPIIFRDEGGDEELVSLRDRGNPMEF